MENDDGIRRQRVRPWCLWVVMVFVSLAAGGTARAQVLFTFVQISDSQPVNGADQARFEGVLDTLLHLGAHRVELHTDLVDATPRVGGSK